MYYLTCNKIACFTYKTSSSSALTSSWGIRCIVPLIPSLNFIYYIKTYIKIYIIKIHITALVWNILIRINETYIVLSIIIAPSILLDAAPVTCRLSLLVHLTNNRSRDCKFLAFSWSYSLSQKEKKNWR